MIIGIAVVMTAGVIFLIVFNIRAIKRPQARSDNKRADRKPELAAAHREAIQPAREPHTDPHNRHGDDEYRQALRSFSAPDAIPETAEEKKEEPSDPSQDDAYREALRALSKRE